MNILTPDNYIDTTKVESVPARVSASTSEVERIRRALSGKDLGLNENPQDVLGSPLGALRNELEVAPGATLGPLLNMLTGIMELGQASVYSPDATFILYMFELGLDVHSHVIHVVQSSSQHHVR